MSGLLHDATDPSNLSYGPMSCRSIVANCGQCGGLETCCELEREVSSSLAAKSSHGAKDLTIIIVQYT